MRYTSFRAVMPLVVIAASIALLAPSLGAAAAPSGQEGTEAALGSAFTYQGLLTRADEPVNGTCRMVFRIFAAQSGGTQIGSDQVFNAVPVADGVFTVVLNGNGQFGPNFANGDERWLQVSVRCGDEPDDTMLPRQQLTAAPYALTALSANGLRGRPVSNAAPQNGQVLGWNGSAWAPRNLPDAADWNSLTNVPPGFADGIDNDSGGDITSVNAGQGLTGGGNSGNVSLALNTTFTDNRYWRQGGNAGTNPLDDFLGTTDDQAFAVHVNNERALRIEPTIRNEDPAPNIILGVAQNGPADGAVGIAVAGGGRDNDPNIVYDHYGFIGGGHGNEAGTNDGNPSAQQAATVGGGSVNRAQGSNSVVAGGTGNRAAETYSTISGGAANEATGQASTISGGSGNVASALFSTIPGGASGLASLHGQLAYSTGKFFIPGPPGQAQMSIYVLLRETATNTSLEELFLDGAADGVGDRLTIAPGRTMAFEIILAARSDNGKSAGFRFLGVIENENNTTRLVGPVVGGQIASDGEFAATVVAADGDIDALQVKVTNTTGGDVRWVAVVYATEVLEG